MGRHATLQKEILLALKKTPAPTIVALATPLGRFRPSVSRSVRKLIEAGLVVKHGRVITLTPAGAEAAKEVKVFKRAKGYLGWVDDQCAEFKCDCGKYEESLVVSVESVTECDGCGRQYVLRQRTWVEEVIG